MLAGTMSVFGHAHKPCSAKPCLFDVRSDPEERHDLVLTPTRGWLLHRECVCLSAHVCIQGSTTNDTPGIQPHRRFLTCSSLLQADSHPDIVQKMQVSMCVVANGLRRTELVSMEL